LAFSIKGGGGVKVPGPWLGHKTRRLRKKVKNIASPKGGGVGVGGGRKRKKKNNNTRRREPSSHLSKKNKTRSGEIWLVRGNLTGAK